MRFDPLALWPGVLVLVWLSGLAWLDLQTRELPHLLSTGPFLLAGVARIIYLPVALSGIDAWLARSALLLLCVVVGVSDMAPLRIPFAITALLLGWQTGATALLVLIVTWLLALTWVRWGIWGGGDAKVMMVLVAVWPDLYLVGALLLALLLGGLLALWQRYGHASPAVLWQVMTALRQGQVPARQTDPAYLTHQAGVPWLALGTALYVAGGVWTLF
jgi:hypothetical protein